MASFCLFFLLFQLSSLFLLSDTIIMWPLWSDWGCGKLDCRYSIKGTVTLTHEQEERVFAQHAKSLESFLSKHRVIRKKLNSYFSDVRQYAQLTHWDTWCCGGAAHHKCWTCVGPRWRCDQSLSHRCCTGRSRLVVSTFNRARLPPTDNYT